MCLEITKLKRDKERFLRKFNEDGIAIFYKVVNIYTNENGPVSDVYNHFWKKGVNKSSRKNKCLTRADICSNVVTKGFHVYTSLKTAKQDLNGAGKAIIPVVCKLSDLVAVGEHNEAVFTKVRWDRQYYYN